MKRKRWFLGGCMTVLILLGVGGWHLSHSLSIPYSMYNQVYQTTKSPDGKYVATLAYRDGMTYGFFYVTLQPSSEWQPLGMHDPIPHDEVVEVAAEGLESIAWKGNNVLIVKYGTSGDDKAVFVLKQNKWHDVHIVY